MKNIDKMISDAFMHSRPLKKGNSEIKNEGVINMYLHGHNIAKNDNGIISINLRGFDTPTTKSRLNSIPGVNVNTKNGIVYLNGNPIETVGWFSI